MPKTPHWVRKYQQASFMFLSLIAEHPPFVERAREIREQFPQAGRAASPYGVGDDYLQAVTELACDLNLISSPDKRNWRWIGQVHSLIWNEPAQAVLPYMYSTIRITLDVEIDTRSSKMEAREQVLQAFEAHWDEIKSKLVYSKGRPTPELERAVRWLFQRVVLNEKPREIYLDEPLRKEDGEDLEHWTVRKAISEIASLLSVKL